MGTTTKKVMNGAQTLASSMFKPASQEDQKEFKKERKASTMVKSRYKNVSLDEFTLLSVIGRGTFGKVFLAEFTRNK